jgi:hypothetical protein
MEAGAGAISADEVGATAALTRNPDDVRKIASDSKKPMAFSPQVVVVLAGVRAVHVVVCAFQQRSRCKQLRSISNASLGFAW